MTHDDIHLFMKGKLKKQFIDPVGVYILYTSCCVEKFSTTSRLQIIIAN